MVWCRLRSGHNKQIMGRDRSTCRINQVSEILVVFQMEKLADTLTRCRVEVEVEVKLWWTLELAFRKRQLWREPSDVGHTGPHIYCPAHLHTLSVPWLWRGKPQYAPRNGSTRFKVHVENPHAELLAHLRTSPFLRPPSRNTVKPDPEISSPWPRPRRQSLTPRRPRRPER